MRFLTFSIIGILFLKLSAQSLQTSVRSWSYMDSGKISAPDSIWDEPADFPIKDQLIVLGFSFKAFGKIMDSLWLDQGGVLSLDQEVWIGVWEDLCDKGLGTRKPLSPISIKHSGAAGNKKVEIQWRNFGFFGDYQANSKCIDSANMRMTISEDQTIEMWFGPSKITNPAINFPKGVVVFADRLDSTGNAEGVDFKGDPANPQLVAVNEVNHSTLNSWPANGQVYKLDFKQNKLNQADLSKQAWYSNGILYIPSPNSRYQIFDMSGRLFAENESDTNVALPLLKSGVYLIRIESPAGIQQLKINL